MLQELKARMQAILEMKNAALEVKRKAAFDALTQEHMRRKIQHDKELAELKAKIEELKKRRDNL